MTATPDLAPIIEPVITAEALEAEARRFAAKLASMSGPDIAVALAWTAGILLGALALLWLLRFGLRLAARWLSPKHDKATEQGKEARRHVGGWTMIAARFVIGIVAVAMILNIWGFDVRTGALGAILGVFWRAGFIIMFALAAVEVFGFVITRSLHRGARHASDLRRAAQLRTLAPVLKGVATSFVAIIAVMLTLSQFGVDIGPLIAGAGVLGLAIGFGAQTLVKDFLTGIFLILEDTVSIGDIVTIAEFGGVVEDMSLRTIKLRDFDGTLHIFPYSEAMVIHNKTKSFSFAVFDLSIDYNSDIARALDLMRDIGAELQQAPELGPKMIDDIEVVGVDRLADSAVILKARIKTAPGQQWTIQREYLKRIKLAFDANGIAIPFPHLKLVPPDSPIPVEPPRAAE
ncbi:MAG TPA: mechanosensitive ion channel domain-containing protein [Vitreimonas sp.]|uniref:mechanosensitive ion channel family protein n=1 Tax=Vitreimonas sp. TaxID=3069702 RepID=UPI002D56C1F4|nr:mechanosensitive ion channel domain-containing protein [Vitreimonas sp.]HYD88638.1 mechanosensitive ion channel domain-containing protein [Vitreimonas sp.]